MLRREVAHPRTRYGALPSRGVDQHPSGIVDICAIICSDRYQLTEQMFTQLTILLEYFGHGEEAEASSRWSSYCRH